MHLGQALQVPLLWTLLAWTPSGLEEVWCFSVTIKKVEAYLWGRLTNLYFLFSLVSSQPVLRGYPSQKQRRPIGCCLEFDSVMVGGPPMALCPCMDARI